MALATDDGRPEEACTAEQRLLSSDDDEAPYAVYQLFTRELAIAGTVAESFDTSLAGAGVPAAAILEARQALSTVIDFGRDVAASDRFVVRYERSFTAEGVSISIGRLLWVELDSKAKGIMAIHRFHPPGGVEGLWLASWQRRPRFACHSKP